MHSTSSWFSTFCSVAVRFFTALSLCLWIGGMAFFGIMAAPVLFHPERSGIARAANTATLAPQMVSAMLTRFGTLTTICGLVLVAGALLDGLLSRSIRNRFWRAQTALSVICLGFSLYLNGVLLPQTRHDQTAILPLIARADRGERLSIAEVASRAAFDRGHSAYQSLASLNIYLLLATLFCLLARGAALPARGSSEADRSEADRSEADRSEADRSENGSETVK